MDANEKHTLMFSQLVFMFHAAAMQQLGKLKNSLTNKVERDLTAAQGTIDLLDMLRVKTTGNLTPDEDRLLNDLLRELRLNYIDEVKKPDPQKPGEKKPDEGKNPEGNQQP